METTEQVTISRAALNEIEQRLVRVNGALLRMRLAIERGDSEAIANQRAYAQELNWTNRQALLRLGAVDSILKDAGMTEYAQDDDTAPVEAEQLDLSDLRNEFGSNDL